jgi:tripartite-type tricarboxylate transporter receptor subunit TctC
MLGPKGLPKEVTKPWEDALKTVLSRPEIIAALGKLNYDVDAQFGTEGLRKYFSDEIARFSVITKERGIKK